MQDAQVQGVTVSATVHTPCLSIMFKGWVVTEQADRDERDQP